MTFFSMIGFTAPWLLVGLFALPLLWILLRAVPPAPIRRVFPGVALLLGLNDETVQADRTPWWLLLLRALVMACLIIGLAGPIVNPAPKGQNLSKLLVVLEGSWADASDWEAQQLAALEVVQQSGNQGRPVAFLQLTAPQKDLVFSAASEAARAIKALSRTPGCRSATGKASLTLWGILTRIGWPHRSIGLAETDWSAIYCATDPSRSP